MGLPVVCATSHRKSNGISVCTRVGPLTDKYRCVSGATASASRDTKHRTRDLEDELAPVQPQPDHRTRAFTAPALDHYARTDPGYPTPPAMVGGISPIPPHPYTPPPAYPSYPAVGFNTGLPDLPPPYPMYPPPGNQAGYSQGYPPHVAYPPAPPPQGAFPVSGMRQCLQGTPRPVNLHRPHICDVMCQWPRDSWDLAHETSHTCVCVCVHVCVHVPDVSPCTYLQGIKGVSNCLLNRLLFSCPLKNGPRLLQSLPFR